MGSIGFLTENYIRIGSELITGILIAGLVLLFAVFILLCVVIAKLGKSSTTPLADAPAVSSAASSYAPAPAYTGVPGETVAAISAAIAVVLEEEGNTTPHTITSITPHEPVKHVQRSVKRAGRPAWNRAGIYENTRPF